MHSVCRDTCRPASVRFSGDGIFQIGILVQPPIGLVFLEFCKSWKTRFWHDLLSMVLESPFTNCCLLNVEEYEDGRLWYNSGVGGVVLMYQPHWGDISALFEPCALFSTDGCPPYGLVGMINPFPAVRGFIFGMYLDALDVIISWRESPSVTCRIDLDFLMADFVGLCKLAVADEYGLLLRSCCITLCSFPIIKYVFPNIIYKYRRNEDNDLLSSKHKKWLIGWFVIDYWLIDWLIHTIHPQIWWEVSAIRMAIRHDTSQNMWWIFKTELTFLWLVASEAINLTRNNTTYYDTRTCPGTGTYWLRIIVVTPILSMAAWRTRIQVKNQQTEIVFIWHPFPFESIQSI